MSGIVWNVNYLLGDTSGLFCRACSRYLCSMEDCIMVYGEFGGPESDFYVFDPLYVVNGRIDPDARTILNCACRQQIGWLRGGSVHLQGVQMRDILSMDLENRPGLLPSLRVPRAIRSRCCNNCNRVVCMDADCSFVNSDLVVISKLMVVNVYYDDSNSYRINCLCGLEIGCLDVDGNIRLTFIERNIDQLLINYVPDVNRRFRPVVLRSVGIDSGIESDSD